MFFQAVGNWQPAWQARGRRMFKERKKLVTVSTQEMFTFFLVSQ
jgi:hypothetical protein